MATSETENIRNFLDWLIDRSPYSGFECSTGNRVVHIPDGAGVMTSDQIRDMIVDEYAEHETEKNAKK